MPTLTFPPTDTPARDRAVRKLGSYMDDAGFSHTIIAAAANHGRLLVDRRDGPDGDMLLVAHIAEGEAAELSIDNERLIAELYLADPSRGHCRLVCPEDLHGEPLAREAAEIDPSQVICAGQTHYRIAKLVRNPGERPRRELRWTRCTPDGRPTSVVTLREVIGALEDYEPASLMTLAVITRCRSATKPIATGALAHELRHVEASPIVLNRRVREAALSFVGSGLTTWSDIARRCGRRRPDGSGETSWVKRRLGVMPDGGQDHPTQWAHQAVLASIARDGLGIDPHLVGA